MGTSLRTFMKECDSEKTNVADLITIADLVTDKLRFPVQRKPTIFLFGKKRLQFPFMVGVK